MYLKFCLGHYQSHLLDSISIQRQRSILIHAARSQIYICSTPSRVPKLLCHLLQQGRSWFIVITSTLWFPERLHWYKIFSWLEGRKPQNRWLWLWCYYTFISKGDWWNSTKLRILFMKFWSDYAHRFTMFELSGKEKIVVVSLPHLQKAAEHHFGLEYWRQQMARLGILLGLLYQLTHRECNPQTYIGS